VAKGMDGDFFFYAAFMDDHFHGLLSAAPIHMSFCIFDPINGAVGVWK
jgi:hypothetical protein